MSNDSLISIIIPCYNHGEYLEKAVRSVLAQSYDQWECIVVDDGSTDDLKMLYAKVQNMDPRITVLKKENGGLSSARNYGIKHSKGSFILPLDADDRIEKDYLKLAIIHLSNDENVKVVYGKAHFFGSKSGPWELPDYSLKQLALKNPIYCSALFRKEDWERVGGYDEKMRYGLEDWEFWIHILKTGGEVIRLNEVCFYYRINQDSMVRSIAIEQRRELWNYLTKKHTNFLVDQLGSLHELQSEWDSEKRRIQNRLSSKRFAVNLFFKRFFGVQLFKKSRMDD